MSNARRVGVCTSRFLEAGFLSVHAFETGKSVLLSYEEIAMRPAALIHVNSIDEKRIAQLLDAIEVKRGQVETLTVSVEKLKSEVDLFQRRYNAHIGRYYLELDKVELETKAYRLRLQLRREQVHEAEIEARVESCFRASRARIEAYAAADASEPTPQADKCPEAKSKHLQNLYRKLAKRYHPDKAMDAEKAERREQLMPLINRAYRERDLQTLERLNLGETTFPVEAETVSEKRAALQSELRELNRAARELRLEINRLKTGRTYQLKQQVEKAKEAGSDLLTGLAKDLERRVKASRAHLARLINIWHRASE